MGTVYDAKRSPVTEIRRIEGPPVTSKEDAIKLGLELAKQWVMSREPAKDKMLHACDMQSGVFPVTRLALF